MSSKNLRHKLVLVAALGVPPSRRLSFEVFDAAENAKYAFDQKVEESGLRVLSARR
jgi:hypothetical protein